MVNDDFIALIHLARQDHEMGLTLAKILRQPRAEREQAVELLLLRLSEQGAPEQLVNAIECLRQDEAVAKVLLVFAQEKVGQPSFWQKFKQSLGLSLAAAMLMVVQVAKAEESLAQKLHKQVRVSGLPSASLGLLVSDSKGAEVFAHNADQLMIPASLTKIISAATVLDHWPPNYQFKTQLYTEGEIGSGVLVGALYLKGGGDPSFVSEKMWFLVNEFVRSGVRKIDGDLVMDDSLFDQDFFPARPDLREDRAYDAPISALSFNWNSVNIYVRPSKLGQPAQVILDPENDYLQLINQAKTAGAGTAKNLQAQKSFRDGKDVFTVSGTIAADATEQVLYRSISQPALWAGANLKSFLRQRGIEVTGEVRRGKTPLAAKLIAESPSKPLSHTVADLMKFSNNYVAEMLMKGLSLDGSNQGNISGGVERVKTYTNSLGLKGVVIENASGFTRANRTRARDLNLVMLSAQKRFDNFPEFLASLPIAGVDGTLKSRMAGSSAAGWVRAKTGLLNGVVGLAGYAGRADGRVWAFTFLFNGADREIFNAQKLFDQMAILLVR